MSNTKQIALTDIRIDGGTQPRTEIDIELVNDYSEHIELLPPVTVFFDGVDYWLADGFHRYHAHFKRDCGSIWCEITNGTQRDAILYSVGANFQHGKRRTNEDKRKAVETLLNDEEWSQWSNVKIAERCFVDEKTVRSYRKELPIIGSSEDKPTRKVERAGKVFDQKVKESPKKPLSSHVADTPIKTPEPEVMPRGIVTPYDEQGPQDEPNYDYEFEFANDAIECLENVSKNNPQRKEVFQAVITWIEANS